MKRTICLFLFVFSLAWVFAGFIAADEAGEIGSAFFTAMGGGEYDQYTVEGYYGKEGSEQPAFYTLRFKPTGFVLLSAEEKAKPVLGYALDTEFPDGDLPPNVSWILEMYANSIDEISAQDHWPVDATWARLRSGDFTAYTQNTVRMFLPGFETLWGQKEYYNSLCPTDTNVADEYGGHVPAGCVAVAMAQIIKYYEQPYRGSGSNTYTPASHPEYGTQSVIFENARYDYSNMPNSLTSGNDDVARLIYHCGVSVNMNYGPEESGSNIDSAAVAFVDHFRFNSADVNWRENSSDPLWMMMLKTELDAQRPVYYRGDAPGPSGGGHAFVLYGYVDIDDGMDADYFMINWGWNGQANGYFSLDPLNQYHIPYVEDQAAIFNLFPLPKPISPSNLAISTSNPFSLQLSWSDNSSNEEGFHIERKLGGVGAEWVGIASVGANVTSYLDGGLTSGYIYNYRVRSFNGNGFSEYSDELNTSTPFYECVIESSIEQYGPSMVYISWESQPNAYRYALYSADEPLPTDDPGWTLVTESAILGYYASATADRKFYHVKVKLIVSAPSNMIHVPGGTFTMGDTRGQGYSDELPTHTVTLNSFYIGKYEVTQAEYSQYMQPSSSWTSYYGLGDNYPAYYVSWYAILKYCNLRSMAEGLTPVYSISGSTNPANWGAVPTSNNATWNAAICNWNANGYRLPTEAEWEYAARGAVDPPDYLYSGSDDINAVAWYSGNNSPYGSKPVGTKAPNELGTYDMSGNLYEWCWDWYSSNYSSSSPQNNPTGPVSGSYRVLRGGYWGNDAVICRVAFRFNYYPYGSFGSDGFRVCRAVP